MNACSRCGTKEHFKDMEYLRHRTIFLNKPTTTTIVLCRNCWQAFIEFLKNQEAEE